MRVRCGPAIGVGLLWVAAPPASAQGSGFEFAYGRWWADSAVASYSLTLSQPLIGPLDYGIGLTHLMQVSASDNRRQTGGEVTLGVWRDGAGPYIILGAGLGVRHLDGNIDAQWSAGAGYALRALRVLSFGVEARYRVEDRELSGFWDLAPFERRGLAIQGVLALRFPRRGGGPRTVVRAPEPQPPSESLILRAASEGDAAGDVAQLRSLVVQTALDAMGTPYQWGGNDDNGFDCSGLIQYAFGQHGLMLPRVSREQAQTGIRIEPEEPRLLPADILGFSVERAGVTHVGLYVGDGLFIHSASDGVKLTSLAGGDSESRWWRDRLVTARRVIN